VSDKSATRDAGVPDNPGQRTVGSDRMAAMERLATTRREEISEQTGVEIEATTDDQLKALGVSTGAVIDPDNPPDDDTVIDPDEGKRGNAASPEDEEEKRKAAEAKAKEEADRKAATARQVAKQSGADDRVVLDGDLSKYVIKRKVDGVETEISLDRVTRVLQKDAAADKRLEDATRLKKEAEEDRKKAEEERATAGEVPPVRGREGRRNAGQGQGRHHALEHVSVTSPRRAPRCSKRTPCR
jgi:ribosomal protein L31E